MTLFPLTTPPQFRSRVAAGAAALAIAAWSLAAAAVEKTPAEILDADGTALMHQHRYAEACPRFAESARLEPGTGVLLRLGLCEEELGKTASAWSAFRDAAARAQRAGDESLRQLATKRADEIAPRVPRVRFVVSSVAGDVTLTCDGAALDAAPVAPIPMDPGAHLVEATPRGRAVIRQTFVLEPRDSVVTIAIHAPAPSPAAPVEDQPPPRESGLPGQRVAALAVGGVGVAGLAVGGILGAVALSGWNHARGECASGYSGCSQDALDQQSRIHAEAAGSTTGFVVGAVGIVGAAVLWWTAPKRGSQIGLRARGDGFGVELSGSF